MSSVESDLNSFNQFALRQIHAGKSLDELFDQWRAENPSNDLYAENVAAINASVADFKNGERGTIAGQHSAELRREFGLDAK
ncbi:MAG: hypothetical protein AB7G28_26240 [Pirellulales bacterium]